jgi:tetratricopeptide (TPR) repeat protein
MRKSLLLLLIVILPIIGDGLAAGLGPGLYRQLSDIREQMDAGKHANALPRLRGLFIDVIDDSYAEAVIRQHLAYCYLELDRLPHALLELSVTLELNTLPTEVNRQLRLLAAQTANRLDRPEEALRHLRGWLAAATALTPEQRALAAQIFHSSGKPEQAITHLEKAVAAKHPPPEAWQRSLLGMYLENKHDKKARKLLRGLIRGHPEKAEYWRYLANLELRSGRPDRALEALALAFEQGLLSTGELARFARLHAAAGMPEKAARLLREWRESGRMSVTLNRLRTEAELWLMAREREKALVLYEKAAELGADGFDDYQRGRILFNEGHWPQSLQALQRALKRGGFEEASKARLLAGIAAVQSGDLASAKTLLSEAAREPATKDQASAWLAGLAER